MTFAKWCPRPTSHGESRASLPLLAAAVAAAVCYCCLPRLLLLLLSSAVANACGCRSTDLLPLLPPRCHSRRSELFERLQRLRASQPDPNMPIGQFVREVLGMDSPEEAPPRPGARRIIRWQIRHVMAVGVQEGHPASKRVRAWVYLRDLQREYGLTGGWVGGIGVGVSYRVAGCLYVCMLDWGCGSGGCCACGI